MVEIVEELFDEWFKKFTEQTGGFKNHEVVEAVEIRVTDNYEK